MSVVGAWRFIVLGVLLGIAALASGRVAVTFLSDEQRDVQIAALAGSFAVVGSVAAFFCFREALREITGRATSRETKPVRVFRLQCPRCAGALTRLPPNFISPLRTYRCESCRIGLGNPRGRLVYSIVVVLAMGTAAMGVLWAMDGARVGYRVAGMSVIVAGYCGWQLFRPLPRRVESVTG
jgi:hypothetical protein